MNTKMETQSAMNNDQSQVDRRLLNICRPKIRFQSHSTWLKHTTRKMLVNLWELWFYFTVAYFFVSYPSFNKK